MHPPRFQITSLQLEVQVRILRQPGYQYVKVVAIHCRDLHFNSLYMSWSRLIGLSLGTLRKVPEEPACVFPSSPFAFPSLACW